MILYEYSFKIYIFFFWFYCVYETITDRISVRKNRSTRTVLSCRTIAFTTRREIELNEKNMIIKILFLPRTFLYILDAEMTLKYLLQSCKNTIAITET